MLEELDSESLLDNLKWFFIAFNIIMGILLYVKMGQKQKYEKMMDDHQNNPNKNKVCFIISHPDDEAMFFVPTIRQLVSAGKEVSLICLSNGNFDGLGKTREKELENSCKLLGISHLYQINNENLQDGPNNTWEVGLIAEIIANYLKKHNYGTLITFDEGGISSHPNHIAAYYGVRYVFHAYLINLQIIYILVST